MKYMIALVFSLSLTVSGAHAVVGLRVAGGHVPPQGTDVRSMALRKATAEEARFWDLLKLSFVAQASQQTQQSRHYTLADGYTAGKITAEGMSTTGPFLGGFACGFLTGLIGTGILWGVTGGDDVPFHLYSEIQEKGSDFSIGFVNGYIERTKQKKRGARLGGGLLGTAGFLVLFLSATN